MCSRCIVAVLLCNNFLSVVGQQKGKGRINPDPIARARELEKFSEDLSALDKQEQKEDPNCPLPPTINAAPTSSLDPRHNVRTALAAHPRAGTTWLRFMLERATSLPCGVEIPAWANVLPHYDQESDVPVRDGVVTKTHSKCWGCWRGANLIRRVTPDTSFVPRLADATAEFRTAGVCLGKDRQQAVAKVNAGDSNQISPCDFEYERAVILYRDPLDIIRSNYHYRTHVLKLRPGNSWAANDYEFPKERAEFYSDFYNTWETFGNNRPTIEVRYEDLKENPLRELRRIVDFLGYESIEDSKLECAVNASTMEKLKSTDRTQYGVKGDSFFGTRDLTESAEDLSYPEHLLDHFEKIGLFRISDKLGYPSRNESRTPKHDSKLAKSTQEEPLDKQEL